ncbi:Bifunctional purine biosynthesis protein PurH [Buchnera aphidicola (Panaphis juglandis)]
MTNDHKKIKTALISVYNKKKIVELAQGLQKKNIEIFTTNNTENFLKKNNITTTNVSKITKYPEILNGKIKTLHPKIFAGILGNRKENHNTIKQYNIPIIDLIVINFYPLENIENHIKFENNIDIGGPAMVRAAAKNHKNTIIITNISDYDYILNVINTTHSFTIMERLKFAKKAFEYTLNYEFLALKMFNKKINTIEGKNQDLLPKKLYIKYHKKQNLKYGENPDQKSALYFQKNNKNRNIDNFKQLNGTDLSYNNIYDANIAYDCVNQFNEPSCVIIKHGNPCGASISNNITDAYSNAYNSDPVSAFGGIIGFNKIINKDVIIKIIKNQFVELIIGPEINLDALNYIKKNKNIKILICGNYKKKNVSKIEIKSINNSLLIQEVNNQKEEYQNWEVVSKKKPTEQEKKYAKFSWKISKFVKSNAIVYTHKYNIISIGSGQTNRIEAVKIANQKYQLNVNRLKIKNKNIIMTSDAFFPFRDSIDECMKNNNQISCIIQPGGSIRDNEVIDAVNQYNICMIFTKKRIFKH